MITKISPETHDLSLLETKSGVELSKLWNVSTSTILKVKKKFRPDLALRSYKFVDKNLIESKIVNWLKECKTNNIIPIIARFCEKENYNSCLLSYYLLQLIANKYKIEIKFPEYDRNLEHSYIKYCTKVCRCGICNLCNTIYNRFKHYGIYINNVKISNLATKYYDFYVNDKSRYKQEFYTKIEEELKND